MSVDNLYVTYDDDGVTHFYINDVEVDEQTWKLRHPMMKEDKGNGRNRDGTGSGRFGQGAVAAGDPDAKERRAQGLRDQRAKAKGGQEVSGD